MQLDKIYDEKKYIRLRRLRNSFCTLHETTDIRLIRRLSLIMPLSLIEVEHGFMLISFTGLIKYCFKIVICSSTYSFNLNTYHGSSIRILKLQKNFSRFSFEEKLCLEKPTQAGARLHCIKGI